MKSASVLLVSKTDSTKEQLSRSWNTDAGFMRIATPATLITLQAPAIGQVFITLQIDAQDSRKMETGFMRPSYSW